MSRHPVVQAWLNGNGSARNVIDRLEHDLEAMESLALKRLNELIFKARELASIATSALDAAAQPSQGTPTTDILERAASLLTVAADVGIDARHEDGTRTPNSLVCEQTAADLKAIAPSSNAQTFDEWWETLPAGKPNRPRKVARAAWEAAIALSATVPITKNDRRWRHLEHGCQWVSWTETNGETHSFDPRNVSTGYQGDLQSMRATADEQSARQVAALKSGALDVR